MQKTYANLMGNQFAPVEAKTRLKQWALAGDKTAQLRLERDPLNAYDRNAIRVLTADFLFLGHIDRAAAATLAPEIDRGRTFQATPFSFNDPKRPLLEVVEVVVEKPSDD